MLGRSSTSLHVLSQPFSKTRDNFFLIFSSVTCDSETVFDFLVSKMTYNVTLMGTLNPTHSLDKAFKKTLCISPQT